MGGLFTLPLGIIKGLFNVIRNIFVKVIFPIAKLMFLFMAFVLVVTFIANIAGIIGFFLFILMFYYYVKGIIFIEPS
jgi:hypothetical protein